MLQLGVVNSVCVGGDLRADSSGQAATPATTFFMYVGTRNLKS